MKAEELHLPKIPSELFHSHHHILKEWVMDPPPIILERLSDRIVMQIYSIKMRRLAELTKIEIQSKEIEAKMYTEIAEVFSQK